MKSYLVLLKKILKEGSNRKDRTGIGTLSVFGYHMEFNLKLGFPLITTKKCHFPAIVHELLWFLKGDTNIKYLNDHNISIWNPWADERGYLGPIYGEQWRSWKTKDGRVIDQIDNVIHLIKNNPNSRRIVVSSWNVGDLHKMALLPCHVLFQFHVVDHVLHCQLYQRSCDVFLGLPFNIASYSLLTHMIAQQCNLKVGNFIWTGGDVHLYKNHIKQAKKQILRRPYLLPKLVINRKPTQIFNYLLQDFNLLNYKYHPSIHAKIAI
ncbi:thymidylate synthase [Buchnera aphidicola str. Bp (Baizongia pistaciae)]|uniref:Thymidylate synthase n=1 Tax=Buchnera aphidicola subsp. Baizongia pistaciae (strain Bp) TaxID=224915 RepID=TYSY_BUCBP|nr:thymidylate synthase [Buchnera aphidicola]P59427.1 RecName: Full=Thymidylate synthase; Short=TS; Short=TSase [Buchnera aphidicola str. Bp (Baizongia pistaciae)]AAO27098.1 thymidylate synthase [Buchnera aphidicola str. Bp (Baizongia pistaciae)]